MPDSLAYSTSTPRNGLPLLFTGQSQKEATVNEALLTIDLLLGAAIESVVSVPPPTPIAGRMWIIGNGATEAFSGRDNYIAAWTEGGWRFLQPYVGLRIHDRAAAAQRIFDGTWKLALAPTAPNGGATVDSEARASIVAILQALKTACIIS
ncbi:MAG: hypothetical protein RIS85_848 [Pseudomonadota bacterium]